MPPLDLSAARAKVARAQAHVSELRTLSKRLLDQEPKPFRIIPRADNRTGWIRVFVRGENPPMPELSMLAGDAIQNTRQALDHAVAALAQASSVRVSQRHQFPIDRYESSYRRNVAKHGQPRTNGPLAGLTVGLDVIEEFQPFQQPEDARDDMLWRLSRYSNADKHREIVAVMSIPREVAFKIVGLGNKPILERMDRRDSPSWRFGETNEVEMMRVRVDPPIPPSAFPRAHLVFAVLFVVGPFGNDELTYAVDVGQFEDMAAHAALILDRLESA